MLTHPKYMRRVSYSSALAIVALVLTGLVLPQRAAALPPLGLTLVDPSAAASEFPRPKLEVIGGTAYVSGPSGVWPIDSAGAQPLIPVSHPTLGVPYSVTRVVDGQGGTLYVGANFGTFSPTGSNSKGAALFQLANVQTPLVTWPAGSAIDGVSSDLRVIGDSCCSDPQHPNLTAAQFFLDGSVSALPVPVGSDYAFVGSVSRLGFGLGDEGVLGDSVVLWPPNGGYVIVEDGAGSRTVRDRSDGTGENIGAAGGYNVYYGSRPPVSVRNQNGIFFIPYAVIVSQGDFVVIADSEHPPIAFYGYYPGAVPGHADRARPLTDFFPQLSTINIASIDDLASVDGYLYMTLRTTGGALYLFGAHDPSVVPEAASIILAIIAVPLCCAPPCRIRRSEKGSRARLAQRR